MTSVAMLDVANAAREVAIVAALALIQAEGEPDAALRILDECAELVPGDDDELDASTIAAQAIRDAVAIRGAR